MRDIKESHSDAVDNVYDFLDDTAYLRQILMDNLRDSLEHWPQFEEALYEASDYPHQEEELSAMSSEIKEIALDRLADEFTVIRIADLDAKSLHINQLQKTITILQDNIEMMKFDAQALRDKYKNRK